MGNGGKMPMTSKHAWKKTSRVVVGTDNRVHECDANALEADQPFAAKRG
jgi:hypothetical protein